MTGWVYVNEPGPKAITLAEGTVDPRNAVVRLRHLRASRNVHDDQLGLDAA